MPRLIFPLQVDLALRAQSTTPRADAVELRTACRKEALTPSSPFDVVKNLSQFCQPGRWCPVCCFAVLAAMSLAAQNSERPAASGEWLIKTWEVESGLPENSATAMVQSADGYLWFGTFRGLVRFDGVKFTVFDSVNTPQLPSDSIVNLHHDQRGRLWVGTLKGLVVREGEQWRRLGPDDGIGAMIRTFTERAGGDLLLTTFDGRVFEFSHGRLTQLPSPPGESGKGYFGQVDVAGQWWVVQDRFIGRWDEEQWRETVAVAGRAGLNPGVMGCAAARDGGMWVLLGRELCKYRGTTEVVRLPLREYPGGVWSLTEDSRGHVWISTHDQGLCEIVPGGEMKRWTAPDGIPSNNVRFVFEDREHNLWIGTSGGGLTRFKPRRFQSVGPERGLSQRVVTSVWPETSGDLLIGTYGGGVFRWGATGVTKIIWPGQGGGPGYIQSVLADRAGRVWAGTYYEGLWILDRGSVRRVPAERTGGPDVKALFEDSRGRVWISGGFGVAVHESGEFRTFEPAQGLPAGGARAFAEDARGAVWLSNGEGVFRLEDERWQEVRETGDRPLREITCLKSDADGAMWLGSSRDGLLRWHSGALVRIGPKQGLPVPGVHGILEDDEHYFWMPSSRGVVRVSRKDLESVTESGESQLVCHLFDLADGLPSVECPQGHQPSCARDGAGRLWFATSKGVTMTDLDRFRLNTVPPPVQIEGLVYYVPSRATTNRAAVEKQAEQRETQVRVSAPFAGPPVLPAGSRRLEIHYAGLSFSTSEKVRFRVRLEGMDFEWHDVENQRMAFYHDLPPGEYKFQVRAANNDGVWNETGASLAFLVQPFFWQTWWFRLLLGVFAMGGVAGTVWGVVRGKLRQHEEHLAHEREIRQAREQLSHLTRVAMLGELSGSLAHELNQPLTAILSNAQAALRFLNAETVDRDELREILKDIADDDQRAGEVIRRLRTLVKRGEVQLQSLDLNDVVRETLRLVRSDLVTRNVTLVAELAAGPLLVKADRVQLQQVFLNLILNGCDAVAGNASEERKLTIRTRRTDNGGVQMTVMDCGHGIPVDQVDRIFDPFVSTKSSGLGLGLAISRSIVVAHGGKLLAANNAGGGASFSFVLPASG